MSLLRVWEFYWSALSSACLISFYFYPFFSPSWYNPQGICISSQNQTGDLFIVRWVFKAFRYGNTSSQLWWIKGKSWNWKETLPWFLAAVWHELWLSEIHGSAFLSCCFLHFVNPDEWSLNSHEFSRAENHIMISLLIAFCDTRTERLFFCEA